MSEEDKYRQTRKSWVKRHPYLTTVGGITAGAALFLGLRGCDRSYDVDIDTFVKPEQVVELFDEQASKVSSLGKFLFSGIEKNAIENHFQDEAIYANNQRDDAQDKLINQQRNRISALEKKLAKSQRSAVTPKKTNERLFKDRDGFEDGIYTDQRDISKLKDLSYIVDNKSFELDAFGNGTLSYDFRVLKDTPEDFQGIKGFFYNPDIGMVDAAAMTRQLALAVDSDNENRRKPGRIDEVLPALDYAHQRGNVKVGTASNKASFEGFKEDFMNLYDSLK